MAKGVWPKLAKMPVSQEEHIIREWEKLNKELEKLMAETRSREKYSITIIAGVAAWGLVDLEDKDRAVGMIVSCIPVISTLLFGLSVLFLYLNIIWIGKYLAKIENYFLNGNPNNFGWERNFREENRMHAFVVITIFIWLLQFYFAVSFYGHMHHWKCWFFLGCG